MNKKTLNTLEYHKIKNQLKKYSVTYLGNEKIDELIPSTNILEIKKMQKETSEAANYILQHNNIPLAPISDITEIIKKIDLGIILNPHELLQINDNLRTSRNLKTTFTSATDEHTFPIIAEYFNTLYTNLNLEKEITRCIKSDDSIDNHASPKLYKIRKKITDTESTIKEKLNNIIHSQSTSKYLQDSVVTFRNNRYVIPVKQEYKNEIAGFIHDSSSSGNTIFIEPTIIFNLNNEIKELQIKEQLEIERILSLLTQMISPLTNFITSNMAQIKNIDFAFAKAKYSLSLNAYEPLFNQEKHINLKNARHPLIPSNSVVPINIWLGKDFNSLIITGPNTGGKTVALKTVGIISLMAQSGMHIPANENSTLCIFKNIHTDIGDEQSIEQSLSTFSSHMKNLVEITNSVKEADLVLLDELGSGTDPVEGSAIAMSILQFLHSKNCLTISTTHYSELKTFAIQTQGIENACCEFNIETLQPTYKLLIGIPGKSNAFAISKKLGLSETILKTATEFLSAENIKFEDILANIEQDKRKAEEDRELSKKMLDNASKTKQIIDKEKETLDKKKDEILIKAKQEARDILIDAEEQANQIIKKLTNLKTSTDVNKNKEAEEYRAKIKKSISELQKDLIIPNKEIKNNLTEKDIKIGTSIYIPSLDQKATILTTPDKKGNIIVQSGIVKLTIHISQIELIKEQEKKSNITITSLVKNKSQNISTEINLIGLTTDIAIETLEKYLDDAYLSNLAIVRIVHGKGTGTLRQAIHKYLKKNPHVENFRLGTYGEGDSGVTIAELKK